LSFAPGTARLRATSAVSASDNASTPRAAFRTGRGASAAAAKATSGNVPGDGDLPVRRACFFHIPVTTGCHISPVCAVSMWAIRTSVRSRRPRGCTRPTTFAPSPCGSSARDHCDRPLNSSAYDRPAAAASARGPSRPAR
jgi:hypothetical protein